VNFNLLELVVFMLVLLSVVHLPPGAWLLSFFLAFVWWIRRLWRMTPTTDYMEDFDLSLRLQIADRVAVTAPDAVGVHRGSATHGWRSPSQRRLFGFGRGYVLRRYRVLQTRYVARTLLTEAIAVVGDLVLSRDLSALPERVGGWRSAKALPPRPWPPAGVIDTSISFAGSLRLRRAIYSRRELS
jgi:hypothetical protein